MLEIILLIRPDSVYVPYGEIRVQICRLAKK